MASVPNNPPRARKTEATRTPKSDAPRAKRERRSSPGKPTSAEVAAEAVSIYPDTFATPPTPDEIAAEAYAIYVERGGQHGRHEDDWHEAERRLRERRNQK